MLEIAYTIADAVGPAGGIAMFVGGIVGCYFAITYLRNLP
jgi:hypothetical protein